MKGVVWTGALEVRDDLEVRAPGPREVTVRIHRAGLCHSDVSVINGTIAFPPPVVLGHEGAGVVEEIGAAVTRLAVGDHVVLTTLGNCGQCDACERGAPTHCRDGVGFAETATRFRFGGRPANQFANTGVFAERTVVHEHQAVRIDPRVPFEAACLIGCAVVTGAGAVLNRAKVAPGQTVLVIGAGGVGQSVIQAARLAAAGRIVVVDANPAKEHVARLFGATDFVDAARANGPDRLLGVLRELGLPNGVHHAFECVGHPALIRSAIDALDWGGTAVLLGVPGRDVEGTFLVASLYQNKTIMGCRYGASRPHHDIPLMAGLYLDGRFRLDEMVSRVYPLDDITSAIDDLAAGSLNRGVLAVA
jgi:S-(hydroxymethyl)glutathione dehydrogenase/alcohol dehydrogenase